MLFPLLLTAVMMFFLSNHPLLMILYLLLTTILLALIISYTISFSWFSYILILILLGAMLIIFLYMASLAPNEIINLNWKSMMNCLLISSFMLFFSSPFLKSPFSSSDQLFNNVISSLTILTASYLLITMIAIVNISSLPKGPIKSN